MEKGQDRMVVLRCVGYPGKSDNKDGFYATCIDLNLVTWRPTRDEAEKSLNKAILGYIDVLSELAVEGNDCRDLFPRRSPFWPYRFRYYLIALQQMMPKFGRHNGESILFKEPVNMPCVTAS